MKTADIGLIGLAVMGENLAINMESKGFCVAVYNRSTDKVERFTQGRAKGKNIIGCHSLKELAENLAYPRKVMMMVKAGQPVDLLIEQLLDVLEAGDIIIDGGNSHFSDTQRRTDYVESKGIFYIGTGVSGGEEGALRGPSLMPGGSPFAWKSIQPIFQSICAKADGEYPCCDWVGNGGAGHFVKMVHNGIEYADMQLICEAYQLLKDVAGLDSEELYKTFAEWNEGELNSYLIEITRDIFAYKDKDGTPLLEHILDTAGQKGTGKWAVAAALDQGEPLTMIGEAVFARALSAKKDERIAASRVMEGPRALTMPDKKMFIRNVRQALYAAKIISYAQGFALMKSAATFYAWQLDYGKIALMWRGGCIIRSAFLGEIKKAYDLEPQLENLMLGSHFHNEILKAQDAWRSVCSVAVLAGIPAPSMLAALAYYDGYRTKYLPSNLLQAQRDYFGAHTYERVDSPRGVFYHTNWTGAGGDTVASTYNA